MRQHQHRRHGGGDRRHLRGGDAGGGFAHQHDLALVALGRDIAFQHIVEGIDGEGLHARRGVVEVGEQLQGRVGVDVDTAQVDALAEMHGDLVVGQIEPSRSHQQRQRGQEVVVVVHHQGVAAHAAVAIAHRAEVTDAVGLAAELGNRRQHLDDGRRQQAGVDGTDAVVDVGQRIALDVGRQVLVGIAARIAGEHEHVHQHAAVLLDAACQLAVGLQGLFGGHQLARQGIDVGDQTVAQAGGEKPLAQFGDLRQGLAAEPGIGLVGLTQALIQGADVVVDGDDAGGTQLAQEILDIGEPGITLRLGEGHRGGDDPGAALPEAVDQARVQGAGPGPPSQFLDTGVVDGDDGDVVGGRGVVVAHAEVVGGEFQSLEAVEQQPGADDQHRDQQAGHPVCLPCSLVHCGGVPVIVVVCWALWATIKG